MDGKYGGRVCVAYASNLAPFKRFCIENYTVLYKIYIVVHRKVKERKGKMEGDWERGYNFPFQLFSPPPSRLFGTATKATCWSSSVDSTKRRKEWKMEETSPLLFHFLLHCPFYSAILLHLPAWWNKDDCVMFVYILLAVTVVFVQVLFLNICFISILLCYFDEICVVYLMISP